MGKRSNFERRDRDFYPTPFKAVEPLLPHLPKGASFAEPCCGEWDLVEHLMSVGFQCEYAGGIEKGQDALSEDAARHMGDCDLIITNPPWDRKILHQMIERFSALKPTWLLFDADWVHTRQAAPYMPLLRKVVSVGRVTWIPDSKMTGKDNCAWHLFDAQADMLSRVTEFYGRAAV